jgi:hypothetical protein
MFTRNPTRKKTDRLFYNTYDSYSMPSHLRRAREKYKSFGVPSASVLHSFLDDCDWEDIDDEEDFLPARPMTGIACMMLMAVRRIYQSIAWIFRRGDQYIPRPIRRFRLHEGIRRLMGLHRRVGAATEDSLDEWETTKPTLLQITNIVEIEELPDGKKEAENGSGEKEAGRIDQASHPL